MDKVSQKEAQIDNAVKLLQSSQRAKKMTNADKAEAHHASDVKNWRSFENNLSSKGFQKAILSHALSDDKLRSYVKNYGEYLSSGNIIGKVPSRTGSHSYEIRRLKSGRLGCGCRDWQYKHSWKGTDCDHIDHFTTTTKSSSVSHGLSRLLLGVMALDRERTNTGKGELARSYSAYLNRKERTGDPRE